MSLTQWYNDQFSQGVEWARNAQQEATDNGALALSQKRHALAVYWSGVAIVLDEIRQSFIATMREFEAGDHTWGGSLEEQDRIAVSIMRGVTARDKIFIPRTAGELSPASALWNKGLLLTGIYMAGRWHGAKLFYDNVMWNKFGWASRTGNSMPFWGDTGVIYQ